MAAALALLALWRIALVAEAGDDPLKTWLYSLQLHFPDSDDKSTEEGGTTQITTHDVECHNVKFDRIRTSEGYLLGDPGLDVYVSGLQLECSGKWKTTGTVSWLVVGDGTITAKLKGDNGARFKAEVKRHWGPIGWIKNARCDMELHFDVSLAGGLAVMVANVIQRMFSPYVSSYLETQIQTKACAAFDELLKEKLHKPIKFLNNLFYPPYSRSPLFAFSASLSMLAACRAAVVKVYLDSINHGLDLRRAHGIEKGYMSLARSLWEMYLDFKREQKELGVGHYEDKRYADFVEARDWNQAFNVPHVKFRTFRQTWFLNHQHGKEPEPW
ncbi:unnamed protein product [Effrenium voratum]|uniref:Uncharacterized protein n=1 Tax=Effrenium voratum TaxID=2562239 RepID=A0AA36IVD2_9DINO|nr:unnamed protein product [Effrenium voratum]